MKNKIYFFQVNFSYGRSAHLPYTAGQLLAYAFADKDVKENYVLENIFFLREEINGVLEKIDNPSVAAFSTYIWNFNYNKTLAQKIKEKYPNCVIIFGGHHVSPGSELLEECPYIDFLLHGEGEIIFKRLLRAVAGLEKAEEIPGISMRSDGKYITNPEMISEECDFPSPYTEGYFDKIIRENPDKDFMALIETSRGCPNSCAYCDWSNMKSKIRLFPRSRISAEIEWVAKHKLPGLGTADSNFGMFSRDEEITDEIVKAKQTYGFPRGFQTSYAKNSNETVFNIGMKLEKSGLNKGITLSFQSMSDEVLENIGRKNISVDNYTSLMAKYNEEGVATYTELILGLPGETYESFSDGIDRLLVSGQHNSIYIHNCEWLPCSIMGQPDYVNKYKIKTSKIPLNQPHRENGGDEITEMSSIVTSTYSMSSDEWKKMNLFSFTVQAFHHMGLLQFFALYLYNEGICSYKEFYSGIVSFAFSDIHSVLGKIYSKIAEYLDAVVAEKGTLCCIDERFGAVSWPFEEYIFLCSVFELDGFYASLENHLKKYFEDEKLFYELFDFQKKMIKRPFQKEVEGKYSYNFPYYFNALLDGEKAELLSEKSAFSLMAREFDSWESFSKIIAWYGRKDSNCTYIRHTLVGKKHEKVNW